MLRILIFTFLNLWVQNLSHCKSLVMSIKNFQWRTQHTCTHTHAHTHRYKHTDRIIMKRKYEDDIPYTNSKYSSISKLLLKANPFHGMSLSVRQNVHYLLVIFILLHDTARWYTRRIFIIRLSIVCSDS